VIGCCEDTNEPPSLCSLLKCSHLYNKILKVKEICGVISSSVYVGPSSVKSFLHAYDSEILIY
jgi:hypothetical protein